MNAVWRKTFSLFFAKTPFPSIVHTTDYYEDSPPWGISKHSCKVLRRLHCFAWLYLLGRPIFSSVKYIHKLQIDSNLIMINPFEEFNNAVWNPRIFWKFCDVKMGCPVTSPTLCSIHWVLRTQGIYDSSNSAKCFLQQASIPTTKCHTEVGYKVETM